MIAQYKFCKGSIIEQYNNNKSWSHVNLQAKLDEDAEIQNMSR